MSSKINLVKRRDPEPTIRRLEEIVDWIKLGKIKLPNFQRPYVWKKDDILNLLDSIYRGYPIGSILLWSTTERLSSERSILESLDFPNEDNTHQSEYLLDGQQRLTSICGVLYWDGIKKTNKWNIYFDLEKEEFVYSDNTDLVNLFPLNRLNDTRSFIKECMKFEHHAKSELFYGRAENLLKAIKDYKIAVVKIGDMTLDEVAPVFERINSKGRVLTMLDLMRAATWKGGFDLTENIDKSIELLKSNGFGVLKPDVVLKCISTSAGMGFNKADIDKLRSLSETQLFQASKDTQESLLKAFVFLRDHLKIHDESFVPYIQQVVLLTELFRLKKKDLSAFEIKQITSWFWSTSFSSYFSGASTGSNNRELDKIRAFATGKSAEISTVKMINLTDVLLDEFHLRNASSSSVAALLSSIMPTRDILESSLKKSEVTKSKEFFHSIVEHGTLKKQNISFLLFLGKSISIHELKNISDELLESNLLDRESLNLLSDQDYDVFAKKRMLLIKTYLERLTDVPIIIE